MPQPSDFPDDFDCLNKKYKQLNCYAKITYPDYLNDQILRDLSKNYKSGDEIKNYIKSLKSSSDYWTCYDSMLA